MTYQWVTALTGKPPPGAWAPAPIRKASASSGYVPGPVPGTEWMATRSAEGPVFTEMSDPGREVQEACDKDT
jgi:hypothetical protein